MISRWFLAGFILVGIGVLIIVIGGAVNMNLSTGAIRTLGKLGFLALIVVAGIRRYERE